MGQQPMSVFVKPGTIITPREDHVQRLSVNESSEIRATVAPRQQVTLGFSARCIDPAKAYPRDSLMSVSPGSLEVTPLDSVKNAPTHMNVCLALACEFASWYGLVGKPSAWSPYQARRMARWMLPLCMISYFGVEAFSNGFPILGLGLFAASACPKWRIGSEAVFKKTSWSERYVEAGVQLTLRGVLGFVGESVTIRVSHDGGTVAVTTSMGRSFSQCECFVFHLFGEAAVNFIFIKEFGFGRKGILVPHVSACFRLEPSLLPMDHMLLPLVTEVSDGLETIC